MLCRALNDFLGLLRSLIGLGSQVANLVRDHGEALAGRTRARSLDGGVQCENIGLEGNVFDGADNLADFLMAVQNILHSRLQIGHTLTAEGNLVAGLIGKLLHLLCRFRVFLCAAVNFRNRGGELLHGAGLLCRTLCQSLCAGGNLIGSRGHLLRRQIDLGERVAQLPVDSAHGLQQSFQIAAISRIVAGADIEVAVCHFAQQISHIAQHRVEGFHHILRGMRENADFILTVEHRAGGGQIALLQKGQTIDARLNRLAEAVGNGDGDSRTHKDNNHKEDDHDHNAGDSGAEEVGRGSMDSNTPTIRALNRRIGNHFVNAFKSITTVARLAGSHFRVNVGQGLISRIRGSLLLNVFHCDKRSVRIRDGVAVLREHVCAAIFTDQNRFHNLVQEGLIGDEVNNACNRAAVYTVFPDRRGDHDGKLSRHLTDGGGGNPAFTLNGVLEIFTIGIIVSVKQAVSVDVEQIPAHHAVAFRPVVDKSFFISHRYGVVAEFGDHAQILSRGAVGGELLSGTIRREWGRKLQRLLHHGLCAGVV